MIKLIILLFSIVLWQHNIHAIIFNKENPIYYFTNQEEQINDLKEKLHTNKIAGITGITGMGKSEMARKYAQNNQNYYDIIAFFDVNVDLISQFTALAKEINQQICLKEGCRIIENPKYVKESLLAYLKNRDKWLLVFDNLHINENDKIKDIISWHHNGHIIICSQDDKYLLAKIPAPYFTEEHAKIIINKIIKNLPEESVQELVNALRGYPPYMIGHSATFLQNNSYITIQDYLKSMKNNDNKVRAHLDVIFNIIDSQAKEVLFKIALLNNQKVSRTLLEQLFEDNEKLSKNIQEIIRFGLIEQISEDRNNQIFRMHDAIKNELLEIAGDSLNKKNIDSILFKINSLIPEVVSDRVTFIKNDPYLESNLEILLKSADKYKANIYQIMQLREKLLWYYWIGIRQPFNAKKMIDWYESHKDKIHLWLCNDQEKASYTAYLTYTGQYYYVANQYYDKALKYLNIAINTLNKFKGHEELKAYVYATIAYIQMSLGEIESAEKNIHKAEETRPSVAITLLGMGLIEYSKSSLLLIKGQYKDALDMILIDINKSNNHKFDKKVLLPEYIAQAQILNYMTNYTDAYEIINTNVYQHLKNKNKDEISPILLARTLIELSRSELGLNKTTEAFNHAEEAVNILKEEEARNNRDIDNSRDVYVAPALVAKGDALASLGKTEESLNDYKLAKNIYWNIYGTKNIGKMDNVSYLLASGAKAARKLPNKIDAQIECDYFYKLLIKFFGNNHPRSIEINGVCNY